MAAAVIILAPGGNVTMKPGTRRKNKYAVVKISYIYNKTPLYFNES